MPAAFIGESCARAGPATASSSATVRNNLFMEPPAGNDTGTREHCKGQQIICPARLRTCATLGHLFEEAAMLSRRELILTPAALRVLRASQSGAEAASGRMSLAMHQNTSSRA